MTAAVAPSRPWDQQEGATLSFLGRPAPWPPWAGASLGPDSASGRSPTSFHLCLAPLTLPTWGQVCPPGCHFASLLLPGVLLPACSQSCCRQTPRSNPSPSAKLGRLGDRSRALLQTNWLQGHLSGARHFLTLLLSVVPSWWPLLLGGTSSCPDLLQARRSHPQRWRAEHSAIAGAGSTLTNGRGGHLLAPARSEPGVPGHASRWHARLRVPAQTTHPADLTQLPSSLPAPRSQGRSPKVSTLHTRVPSTHPQLRSHPVS